MTHEKKLQEITADIRRKLPRLMELKEGCLLKPHWGESEYIIDAIKPTSISIHRIKDGVNTLVPKDKVELEKNYTIIGAEPKLYDLAEYLYNKEPKIDIAKDIKWDITKIYLKDQGEELIYFLHNLIRR